MPMPIPLPKEYPTQLGYGLGDMLVPTPLVARLEMMTLAVMVMALLAVMATEVHHWQAAVEARWLALP